MSSHLCNLVIPEGEDHRRTFKSCANPMLIMANAVFLVSGGIVILLTLLTGIPIPVLTLLLYFGGAFCITVSLLGLAAVFKYDGLMYLYFLVLLTFSVLAIFVSTVVLTNLSDEATVVRGFAHHHWASVYSEALSNETKLTMGFNCEPDQTTGMTHAQSFTPCWEQAKPDLHMHFIVIAGEILGGMAVLSMATLAVMYLDLGLPAIVELTMNGIEAFTIVLSVCVVATGALTTHMLAKYNFNPLAGVTLFSVGCMQLLIGLWGMHTLNSPSDGPTGQDRAYATVNFDGDQKFRRYKKIYGWMLLVLSLALGASGLVAFVQKDNVSQYFDSDAGRGRFLATANIGMLLNISGCFSVSTSVFIVIQMFGLCFYISRIPDDQTRDSML